MESRCRKMYCMPEIRTEVHDKSIASRASDGPPAVRSGVSISPRPSNFPTSPSLALRPHFQSSHHLPQMLSYCITIPMGRCFSPLLRFPRTHVAPRFSRCADLPGSGICCLGRFNVGDRTAPQMLMEETIDKRRDLWPKMMIRNSTSLSFHSTLSKKSGKEKQNVNNYGN
jgi:hypothetical protein